MSDLRPGIHVTVDWLLNDHHGRAGTITDIGDMPHGPFRYEPACHIRYDDAKSTLPGAANDHWIPARFLTADEPAGQHTENPGEPT